MCDTWPTYADWFVKDAFTEDVSIWTNASPQSHNPKITAPEVLIPQFLLLYSMNDELLDLGQTTRFQSHLSSITTVSVDKGSLKGTHDGVLKEDRFYEVIKEFILSTEK